MSTLLVDHDAPQHIDRPSWTARWHIESIDFAQTDAYLDFTAVRIYSDIAHDVDDVLDLVRTVRAAILVRRAELRDLAEAHSAALISWVEETRARSRRHGYHVLPHHEGGYQVEREGISLMRCTSRREAYEQRNALAAAAEARDFA